MEDIDGLDFEAKVEDLTPALAAAAGQITEELLGWLECDLESERDAVALGEAMRKATSAGAREALNAIKARLASAGIEIDLSFVVACDVDAWAEVYGDDTDQGA